MQCPAHRRSRLARATQSGLLWTVSLAAAMSSGCGERYEPKPPAPVVSNPARAPRPSGSGTQGAVQPPAPQQAAVAPASAAPAPGSAAATASPAASSGQAPAAVPAPADAAARPTWPVSGPTDDASVARVGGILFPKPAAWTWTQPSMQFRALQYAVPAPAGAGAGAAELVFSVFAAGDGGPVEPNVQRWISQFRDQEGKPAPSVRSERTVSGMQVILLELSGAYQGMGAAAPRPGMKQLGAVVQAPGRTIYVRLVGPASTVDSARDAFAAMIDGMRPDSAP